MKRKINMIVFFMTLLFSIMIFSDMGLAKPTTADAFKAFFSEYKIQLAGFVGIGIMISILSFAINFVKLAMCGSNGAMRSMVIRNLIISGICTALLGAFGFICAFVFQIFFQPIA